MPSSIFLCNTYESFFSRSFQPSRTFLIAVIIYYCWSSSWTTSSTTTIVSSFPISSPITGITSASITCTRTNTFRQRDVAVPSSSQKAMLPAAARRRQQRNTCTRNIICRKKRSGSELYNDFSSQSSPSPLNVAASSSHLAKNQNDETKPYLELIHKDTNTTIVLIGCLHGSTSSSNDVERILNQQPTDVVVLELCPTRFKDLKRYMLQKKSSSSSSSIQQEQSGSMFMNNEYLEMVSKTIQTRGISTGIAAGILGGASSISSSLSGFETGLEFITAIEYVERHNKRNNSCNDSCDIILGDRLVDETMKGVGSLPRISLNMWNQFINPSRSSTTLSSTTATPTNVKFNWKETYGIDANVASDAIFGDNKLKQAGYQIDMGKVLTRNENVKNDLLRLLLPTFAFVQMTILLSNGSLLALAASTNNLSTLPQEMNMILDISLLMTDTDWNNLLVNFIVEVITSGLILAIGYISLALPAVRVILTERDDQLTESIVAACKIASTKQSRDVVEGIEEEEVNEDGIKRAKQGRAKRVVAVLGLLHVNGIAKKLIEETY